MSNVDIIRLDQSMYIGQMKNGKRHGVGVMKYRSGRMYEGEWKDDLREGIGFEKFENGNIYKGDFAFGKAQG